MRDVKFDRIELDKGRQTRDGRVVVDGVGIVQVNKDLKSFKMHLIPKNLVDAAIGRLFFMGLIGTFDDVLNIKREANTVEVTITPQSLDLQRIKADPRVGADVLSLCMKTLFESTDVWEITGGVHSAGLFTLKGELLISSDDIGKGNAIDTVIGKGLKQGIDFSGCILASTGRQIGFMIEKAVRAGISVVVSRGAPLNSSIETAEEYGVTLVCFAKGKRMNVYTHGNRILL